METWALRRCRSIITLLTYRRVVDDELLKQLREILEYMDNFIPPIGEEKP